MQAIDAALELEFDYDDENWLSTSSVGISRNGRSLLVGCCADLDVIAIKIAEPSIRDVLNPSTY